MSEEGSSSLGDCYIPTFHLSDQYTYLTYIQPNASVSAPHYNGVKDGNRPVFFHGNTLINWGMLAMPRHPLFLHTLTNIVNIVHTEYTRQSVVHMSRWDKRWKQVMCTTGFVLTFTLRELELQGVLAEEEVPRIMSMNFREYKGNVKAFSTRDDPTHYWKVMERKGGPHILKEFAPVPVSKIISFLENRAVMGDTGAGIYFIKGGKKYSFGSYETFLNLGFTDRGTRHVSDNILQQIPDGGELPANGVVVIESSAGPQPPSAPSAPQSALPSTDQDSSSVAELLQKTVATIIERNNTECFSDDYAGSRDDFLKGKYKDLLGDTAVMVVPMCMTTYQLGNTFGYLINDMACADIAGMHFLGIPHRFRITHPQMLQATGDQQFAFFHNLPSRRVHSQPKSMAEAQQLARDRCHCLQYCWENNDAAWLHRVPLVREALLPAVQAYTQATGGFQQSTVLSNDTDRLYLPPALQKTYAVNYRDNKEFKLTPQLQRVPLPLVPNVTIQYRCGDNIGFGKTKYGLLPFSVYNPRRISVYSEDSASSIFILIVADSPQRNSVHPYSYRCETILDRLVAFLVARYPRAVIALKRGGDIFLDYTRIMYSNVVFCSASTFCLWPGLANEVGHVYYPLTPLIAKASSNETAPALKANFHWIGEVDMIKQFKHYRPWTRLIDELETL